jgi:hypothetical protein
MNYQFDEDAAKRLFGGKDVLKEVFKMQNPGDWSEKPWVTVFLTAIGQIEPAKPIEQLGS